jgi:hypothetical protein
MTTICAPRASTRKTRGRNGPIRATAPTAGFSSTLTKQPACRTIPDERIAGYAAGRQLRTGIVIGYWDEAELAAERKRLGLE